MSRVSPAGSPTKWMATLSPRPASTWRSTALTHALSSASANHFAKGGLLQSSDCVKGVLGPKALVVGLGLLVEVGRAVRLRVEVGQGREGLSLVDEVLERLFAHGVTLSHRRWCGRATRALGGRATWLAQLKRRLVRASR